MNTVFDYLDLDYLARTAEDFAKRYPEHDFSEDEAYDIYCDVYDIGLQTSGALLLAGILETDHPKLAHIIALQSRPGTVKSSEYAVPEGCPF